MSSVGGLLPRDLLDRVAAGDSSLPGVDPTDYGLVPGERLSDAVTRSWNRLQGVWASFREALVAVPDGEAATALTRERWSRPLFEELGYAGLPAGGLSVDGKDYPISHLWGAMVPVHLPGAGVRVDRRSPGVAGAARTSPHGLVQEFLNRSDAALWGMVCNGLVLHLLRDNASMTRQAYVEFDLEAIFDGEAFSDFVLLWLCCHRTRFEGEPAEKCLLEQWTTTAASEGTRALERLREGVEAAITELGEGFIRHPANGGLRDALRAGELPVEEYQRLLLRLVYRLLFLLVAESRDLLLDTEAEETARQRYRSFYSVERLRTLASRRRGTAHHDLWASLLVTMRALDSSGAPALGLKPLGSFLWSAEAIGVLGSARIDNRHLLDAVRHLCQTRDVEGKVVRQVDYRNMGAEELGSVYESLLELHAVLDVDGRTFELETAAGNERKTTGSYYTPTSLIDVLLDSALDPVLDEAVRAVNPAAALLALKVVDPAVGSGHFLIAASHRIAGRLASVRAGGSEPTPGELRHALRDVIGHCIYGIDVNPMAVELCKVSLWMEATEPGRPLSFLDHRIVCGNSLLGTTPALIEAGVPDAAFKPITGDDKDWAATLRKTNKRERTHAAQGMLDFGPALADDVAALAKGMVDLDALGDDSVEAIAAKHRRLAEIQASVAAERARLAADAWCAAFVTPKTQGQPLLTDAVVRQCGQSPEKVSSDLRALVDGLATDYRFLHLHVTFPDVFRVPDDPDDAENELCGWNGGFDVVLGNPPWERVKLQEKEWFAARDPEIAAAPNAAARKRLIAELKDKDEGRPLHGAFLADLRRAEGESALLRNSGRYPLGGRGDVNTYAVFAELMRNAISPTGRVGVIVPTGIATDDTTKLFFADLVDRSSLVSLFDFENRRKVFPGIDSRIKFSLLTLTGDAQPQDEAEFVFFALDVADLEDHEKRFTLSPEDFALLNPNTKTCPVFRSRRDAEITKAIYRRVPVLLKEGDPNGNPWGVKFSTMFHMSNDSHLFRTREDLESDGWTLEGNHFAHGEDRYLPLYEAKMIHHFDHRWATYDGDEIRNVTSGERRDPTFVVLPRYWVLEAEVGARMSERPWLLGWRDIARATDSRTFIAAVIPRAALGNKVPVFDSPSDELHTVTAPMSGFAADFAVRQKVGGTTMNFFYVRQFPLPTPALLRPIRHLLAPRVLELAFTAWDLAGFAADLGYHGAPFRWDDERRTLLRSELDALTFRLYGTARADADYILDTFVTVKDEDESAHGDYRTRRLILERLDEMADAEAAGRPYETVLDPPPAHPSLAHPESTRPSWARVE